LYVLIDDSSTGYAAGIDAYAIDGARGELSFLGRFLWRVGSHGSVPRLDSVELDAAGRFLWEVSRIPRPRIVTYAIAETGGLRRVGEVDVPGAEPLEAAAHRSGPFVYAVARLPGSAGSTLLLYRVADDRGLLSLVGRVEAGAVPTSPELIALDPNGRFLYLLTSSGIASYAIDTTSGALRGTGPPRGSGRSGYLAVEPSGRFLYVSESDTREVRAYAIDPQSGSLSPVGAVAAGGGDLAILSERPTPSADPGWG
jgi:6-phosphogluconolactonase (cycloisomerase 2 family)